MNLVIATVLITLVVFAAVWFVFAIGVKYEEMKAFTEVEARFRKMWDGSQTSELHTWMKLRRCLENEKAPTILIEAVQKHIAMARQRHRTYRVMTLKNGRRIIVSTQN